MSADRPIRESWQYLIQDGDVKIAIGAGDPHGEHYCLTLEVAPSAHQMVALLSHEGLDRLQEALQRLVKLDSPA